MADNKDLVRRVGGYSGDEDGSHVIFDSRNPSFGSKAKDLGTSAGAEKSANVLNQLRKDSSVIKQDMGIWRGVTPGYAAHTYGQQAIQGLMDLKGMKDNSDLIVYDTEILGTAPMHRKSKANLGFYTPTEIGFQHVKMVNGQLQPQGNSLSMLLQPNKDVHAHLQGLINNVSNGNWTGMTDDVRRTLSDLTLYAGDPGKLFTETKKDGRRIVSVNSQARELHPLKGSVLSSSNNIAMMKQGLDNLMKWGTKPEDAITEMNAFMSNMENTRFAGYNVYNFDQPMMMDYLNNQVGKNITDSKVAQSLDRLKNVMSLNQVDGLHAVRTLYRDTYSRYGENVTLETMKKVFRVDDGGQSHHALSDVNVTIEQLNRLIQSPGIDKVLKAGGNKGTDFGMFNNASIKVGDRLFGKAGLTSQNAGEYDGVFRTRNGKLTPAYDMKTNPLYRNATYQVKNFYDGVKIDGKDMFGVELYNESDDLTHTIFRESMGDLQATIHNHLEYISRKTDKHTNAAITQNRDRARRRWDKMFSTESGGGIPLANRLYEALDITRKGEKEGLSASQIKANILGASDWNTDEFVRDFQTMRGRLEGEEQWIRGFMNRIDQSPLKGKSAYQMRSQNLAFAEFGKLLNNEFGKNESPQRIPNNGRALSLNLDGEVNHIRLNDADSLRGSLYGHLYKGHVGRPNMSVIKKRYRDMLLQLKSYNALEAKKFEQMYKAMDDLSPNASMDNLLSELSNTVMQAQETSTLNGAIQNIRVENPTRVVDTQRNPRKSRMDEAFGTKFESLASQAINGTSPYQTFWDGKNIQLGNGKGAQVIAQHDEAIKQMLARNGITADTGVSTAQMTSSRSSLTRLADAYAKQDMHVQIRYDGKRNGLQMILADKGVAESLLNGSIEDIMKSNQTAVVDLPRINADGTLTMGAQNRVARLKARRTQSGYQFVTGFDEIMGTLSGNAKIVRDMLDTAKLDGDRDGMLRVHGHLNRRAKKAMQNLSMNNRYGNPNDTENMFEVRSQAANWVRGGAIDISDYAEDWYKSWYANQDEDRKKLWRLKTPDEIKRLSQENKELFANSMGIQARRVFQRQADDFIREQTNGGLDLGMHSVKDTHVSNYLRANLDSRQLLPFGYYNPMARENIMKTVNYASLDAEAVKEKLRAQGYSESEINRMTQRGVVSQKATEVLEEYQGQGKLSYLNMRAAYMDDNSLQKRALDVAGNYDIKAKMAQTEEEKLKYQGYAERLRNTESISTWDGMFLMSDEAARAFETTREKKIGLSEGARLTDPIQQILQASAQINGQEFDLNKNMEFSKMMDLTDSKYWGGQIKDGKLTVSEIVKTDISFDAESNPIEKTTTKADQVFSKWNIGNMKVKGWNAEEQKLILEERVFSANTTKFITDAGGRQTATMLPQEVINDLAGVGSGATNVHAIMPSFETSKKMYGTEVSKFVSLAVDEAKAQIDKNGGRLTVGDIGKQEALETINRIMQESFGIRDKSLSRVQNGQIVVDELIGTNDDKKMEYKYSNIDKFLNRVDEELGLGLSGQKTILGNVGVGRQDIYDWEDGVGLTDEHRAGLVKYGRKEVDMVTARANEKLGKGSAVVGWLNNHIQQASKAQTPGIQRIAQGLIRTAVEPLEYTPDAGDVVIKTSGTAFHPDDPMGREHGRIASNGVREISMHAINDTPKITAKDMKSIADDYAGTIVDFGRTKGTFADGVTFSQAIEANKGTAVLEMPDDTFAQKHVRLVDFGDISKGGTVDTPILRELQKTQQQIWRGIQEYNALGKNGEEVDPERIAKVRGRVDMLAEQYQDQAARMVTNARDSGLMKTFGAAQMDMAGRFRIQGVNPFANYEQTADGWKQAENARYKEGTVYMSRNRLGEMISGAERNIAQVMNIDVEGLKGADLTNKVLDNINEKGLYGFVNRYPTIKQSTIQSMRVMVDDAMDANDRGARLTVGTAQRLKADYDGDFLSTVLAHYSTEDAGTIHKELKQLSEIEAQEGLKEGSKVLADLEGDLNNTAKQMNLTAGELAKRINEASQVTEGRTKEQDKLLTLFDKEIGTRLNAKDALETREARLGKEFVGFIDNTRDKVLNLATSTMEALERHGRVQSGVANEYRNTIESFTAAFSQDLISSKKFDIEAEVTRQKQLDASINTQEAEKRAMQAVDRRWEKVVDMNEAVMNPTPDNLDLFRQHNEEIQLFKTDSPENVAKMNDALGKIQDVARWNSKAGGFNNTSLLMSVSEGRGANMTRQFLNGEGDMIVPTAATNNLAKWAPSEIGERLNKGMNNWENSVVRNFDGVDTMTGSLVDAMGDRAVSAPDHVLNGATVAEEASGKLRGMASKFVPKSLHGGGFGGGAVAFGAMWAASALVRSGPTPEGLQEQTQPPAPPPPSSMGTPTVRVAENNGEHVNIQINAKNAQGMSEQDIAALVHQELGAMSPVKMDTTLNVNDNTQNIDQQWLQGIVANVMNKGLGF